MADIEFTGSNAVTDQNDNPIQGATVVAVLLGRSNTPATAQTDANGEATITGLIGGEYRTWAEKDMDTDGDLEMSQVQIRVIDGITGQINFNFGEVNYSITAATI